MGYAKMVLEVQGNYKESNNPEKKGQGLWSPWFLLYT